MKKERKTQRLKYKEVKKCKNWVKNNKIKMKTGENEHKDINKERWKSVKKDKE